MALSETLMTGTTVMTRPIGAKATDTLRTCGACKACCTVLEIASEPGKSTTFDTGEDIAKPAGQRCRFLGDNGCSIYYFRPVVCREFRCDWLIERKGFAFGDKPEDVGVIGVRGVNYSIRAG